MNGQQLSPQLLRNIMHKLERLPAETKNGITSYPCTLSARTKAVVLACLQSEAEMQEVLGSFTVGEDGELMLDTLEANDGDGEDDT